MIRLTKQPKPQVLVDNEAAWTDEYARKIAGDPAVPDAALTRYRHPDVKRAIETETHGKCAYCESHVTHNQPGDCEHILPKAHRADLIVIWDNLTLVCRECNARKRDYYSDVEPLVNPFADDPAVHLRFFGPVVLERPGDNKGLLTIDKLGLQRMELVERRRERMERVHLLLTRWISITAGPTKDVLKRAIEREAADDTEYAATVRAMLKATDEWPNGDSGS